MDVLNEFPLVDEHGKRYREFGHGCREYAPTIVTTVGTVPAGTVICKHTEPEAVKPKKDCPFSNSLYPECKRAIAAFTQTASASRERQRQTNVALSLHV